MSPILASKWRFVVIEHRVGREARRETSGEQGWRVASVAVAGDLIYAFRVMRLPLVDADGETIGRIDDIVLAPAGAKEAPRVLGFVATSQRRRIFVNAARLAELEP